MKFALSLIVLILFALIVPFFLPGTGRIGLDSDSGLPWKIEVDGAGGSRVFGVQPGVSTLAEVEHRFGEGIEVAIVAAPDELGQVEGYYAQLLLGFVQARMIVTVDVPEKAIIDMRERALKARHMESTTRKITLHPDDRSAVANLPVRAIAVIPTVNLDEATLIQRFGQPDERIVVSDKRTHLLFQKQGLDVVLDKDGKELLQYVAPRDFARLREPLLVAPADPPR